MPLQAHAQGGEAQVTEHVPLARAQSHALSHHTDNKFDKSQGRNKRLFKPKAFLFRHFHQHAGIKPA